MAFKDTLKEHMDKKGFIAADLARETGLSEAIISMYLSGKKEPSGRSLNKISSVLSVSMDTLLSTEWATSEDDNAEFFDYRNVNTGEKILSSREKQLIEILRSLPEDERQSIYDFAAFQNQKYQTKAFEDIE